MKPKVGIHRSPSDILCRGVLTAILLIGVGVLVGWHGHIRLLIQILPGVIPMQYNTALCFLALAASGWIRISDSHRPARTRIVSAAGGALVCVMGALVIFEYATGRSLGIDTLFFYPWDQTLNANPGRMA